jgi:hypothetical protein
MTTPGGIGRTVRQHGNDIEAIYDILGRIERRQQDHEVRLDRLAGTQAEHTAVLDQHTAVLDQHTTTLADHGVKLDRILALLEER